LQDLQFFGRDQQLDASSDARLPADQSKPFEGKDHLVDRWRADAKVALQIGFGGRAAEDAGLGVDEGQILALLDGEAGCRGVHVR
jgi:hypothetical protein